MKPALRLTTLAALALGTVAAASANLLSNASFEGPNVPSWTNWTGPNGFMNVYNNNGLNGFIPPNFSGNFTGVVARTGDQFVAGYSNGTTEGYISHILPVVLTAGNTYQVSAWLHQAIRSDLDHPSTYRVVLSTSPTNFSNSVSVGTFAPTVSSSQGWVFRSFVFTAPTNTALSTVNFFATKLSTQIDSYAGLDDVDLVAMPVPEPATSSLALAALLTLRRRRKASRS